MRTEIAAAVASFSLLASPVALALSSAAATGKAEAFVHAMVKGDFTGPERNFTTAMKQAAPPKKLAAIWAARTGSLGKFRRLGTTKAVDYQSYKIVFVKTEFKTSSLWVKVVFDGAGRIAGLFFVPAAMAP